MRRVESFCGALKAEFYEGRNLFFDDVLLKKLVGKLATYFSVVCLRIGLIGVTE